MNVTEILAHNSTLEIAHRHGLPVIEDAAQAISAEENGQRAGSMGDLGCFSFYPAKNLGAYGDGSMVTTKDPDFAEKTGVLRRQGSKRKYHNGEGNCAVQCAYGHGLRPVDRMRTRCNGRHLE